MTWGTIQAEPLRLCLTYNGTIAIHFESHSISDSDIRGWALSLNHTKAVPEPMAAAGTIRRECYELCEAENSNLRKLLAWAGYRLSERDRNVLAGMIRKNHDGGGVIEDSADDDLEESTEIKRKCVKAAELLREAVERIPATAGMDGWCGRADALASALMEYDPPQPQNLAALRQEGIT